MAFVQMGLTADVPAGHGLLVEKDGKSVALFNAGGGRFYACSPLCPHEDGPLAEGWLEAQSVVCPWHGFDFDLATGKCSYLPGYAMANVDNVDIVIRGRGDKVHEIAGKLIATKGVQNGKLVTTTPEMKH